MTEMVRILIDVPSTRIWGKDSVAANCQLSSNQTRGAVVALHNGLIFKLVELW